MRVSQPGRTTSRAANRRATRRPRRRTSVLMTGGGRRWRGEPVTPYVRARRRSVHRPAEKVARPPAAPLIGAPRPRLSAAALMDAPADLTVLLLDAQAGKPEALD